MRKASRIMLFIEKVGVFDVSLKTFGRCEEQVSLIFLAIGKDRTWCQQDPQQHT